MKSKLYLIQGLLINTKHLIIQALPIQCEVTSKSKRDAKIKGRLYLEEKYKDELQNNYKVILNKNPLLKEVIYES